MKKINKQNLLSALLAASVCISAALPSVVMADPGSSPGNGSGYGRHGFDKANMTPEQKKAWEEKREARHEQMQKELGLSPEQAAKIKAIREQNHGQAKTLHEQLHTKRQSLMEYMSSENADPAKAKSMQQEVDQLQQKLSDLRMNTWFEMRKNMTPEQLAKMKQMREAHRQGGPGQNGGFGGPNTQGFAGKGRFQPKGQQ